MVGIVTLAVVTGALAYVGWHIRPASGGFPTVPSDLGVLVVSPPTAHLTEDLTLSSGGGAALQLLDLDVTPASWTIDLNFIGAGHVCTPSSYVLGLDGGGALETVPTKHQTVTHPRIATVGTAYDVTQVRGSGPIYLKVCWSSDAPVGRNGAYLTALFPPVSPFSGAGAYAVTRQLNLGAADAADYVLQSIAQPTSVTQGGWQWSPRFAAAQPITLSAVDTSETQHDSYQAFLSGILLGVAGGALVALIQELVAPFRSRRELAPPEPGG